MRTPVARPRLAHVAGRRVRWPSARGRISVSVCPLRRLPWSQPCPPCQRWRSSSPRRSCRWRVAHRLDRRRLLQLLRLHRRPQSRPILRRLATCPVLGSSAHLPRRRFAACGRRRARLEHPDAVWSADPSRAVVACARIADPCARAAIERGQWADGASTAQAFGVALPVAAGGHVMQAAEPRCE